MPRPVQKMGLLESGKQHGSCYTHYTNIWKRDKERGDTYICMYLDMSKWIHTRAHIVLMHNYALSTNAW